MVSALMTKQARAHRKNIVKRTLQKRCPNLNSYIKGVRNVKQMTYEQYFDKVLGCWIGKTLGGCGGVAYEGVKRKIENIDFKQIINTDLPNDDFDLQVMWLQGLEQYGPYFSSSQMASLWEQACKYPWSEYGYFMKNHKRGIKSPYSGWFNNEFFKNGLGCPIRSEIWAVSFPGMFDLAAKMAMQDATLDHAEDAMWGEFFLARLESMLFLTDRQLIIIFRSKSPSAI